tara:strand:+ start:60 stop:182 length:123 start_codon:yes stop_codon:yes gene_type:complete
MNRLTDEKSHFHSDLAGLILNVPDGKGEMDAELNFTKKRL